MRRRRAVTATSALVAAMVAAIAALAFAIVIFFASMVLPSPDSGLVDALIGIAFVSVVGVTAVVVFREVREKLTHPGS